MPNRQTCAITRLDTVDSVLTYARAMAQKGAFGLWESVTAERQTAGRGQYGRVWDNLWTTKKTLWTKISVDKITLWKKE